jgi:phosphocarrier protein
MVEANIVVNHEVGLHARPAAQFVKAAQSFDAAITVANVTKDSDAVDAKSILRVLTLAVLQGNEIKITAEGEDEENALSTLLELIESNFGE